MLQFRKGDMWLAYDGADLFLITTNSTLRRNGALVMGRGIARQARDRFPGLDLALGREIARRCGNLGEYDLLVGPRWPAAKLGAFQVKTDFARPASLSLIRRSAATLLAWCERHPHATVHLNFPGIGNGGLARAQVLPLVKSLPDSVCLWEYTRATMNTVAPGL
jgi:hypothetical protein